jgi:hypothetical protein
MIACRWELKKLHPGGLTTDWLDKMHDQLFFSDSAQHTHEHYIQVGRTSAPTEPRAGGRAGKRASGHPAGCDPPHESVCRSVMGCG